MEILFHAKRKDNGGWVEGQHIIMWGKHFIITEYDAFPVEAKTVGAYTGLTDKNKNKIFEGDILKASTGCIFVVEWEKEGRFLGFTSDGSIAYINREPKAEIIGNIHDNPELMGRDVSEI